MVGVNVGVVRVGMPDWTPSTDEREFKSIFVIVGVSNAGTFEVLGDEGVGLFL